MVEERAAAIRSSLYRLVTALVACASLHAAYAQTAEQARETQRRMLEAERQEHLRQKSAEEEARASAAKPVERKRDERACEGARLAYQSYCGSPAAPRWRNPNCREAEKQLLYAC